jgi:MFS family permease
LRRTRPCKTSTSHLHTVAKMSEKHTAEINHDHVDHDDSLEKPTVVAEKIVMGDQGFNQAMIKEPPSPFNSIALQLYLISIIGFCCSTSNGFDSSLFGSLLANKSFLNFFSVGNVGLKAGIVSSMNQIGAVVSLPFVGPAIDTFGRKAGMFIGGSVIILGVIIQGTCIHTHSVGQFMGGRFFMGMGVNLIAAAGPVYVVEISHPAYRGVVTGFYNVYVFVHLHSRSIQSRKLILINRFWPVGALVASCACRGTIEWGNNASWILPIWLQMSK